MFLGWRNTITTKISTFTMLPDIMNISAPKEEAVAGIDFSVTTQQGGKYWYDIYRLVTITVIQLCIHRHAKHYLPVMGRKMYFLRIQMYFLRIHHPNTKSKDIVRNRTLTLI